MREFEYCLRCGQPLTSWLSRRTGFGLQCFETLTRTERSQLVNAAHALQADIDLLAAAPRRHRWWRTALHQLRLTRHARS